MYNGKINLSSKLEHFPVSRLNGPGRRFIVYTQGCAHPCTTQCLNLDNLRHVERFLYSIEEIVNYIKIRKEKQSFEGITFLGGEPFDQARLLGDLAQKCQSIDLTVMTYSGRTYESLKNENRDDYEKLLKYTDILIDGPFKAEQYEQGLVWRGSKNQRIIILSNAYPENQIFNKENIVKGSNVLISFNDNLIHYTGRQHTDDSREQQFIHTFFQKLSQHSKG